MMYIARTLLTSIVIAVVFTLLPACAKSSDSLIVDKSRAVGVIVVPDKPTKAEQFAAEEVQIYLKKMSGAEVPIVKGAISDSKTAIIVGHHPKTAQVQKALKKYSGSNEAFAVVGRNNRLMLVGNGETATIYAAWDWLESLGVRWPFPTERGEYVPQKKTIGIANIRKLDAPAMQVRGPSYAMSPLYSHPEDVKREVHGLPETALFTQRMRMNLNSSSDFADTWTIIGSGHSYMYYLPVSYFKEHPEWFNMINGKRTDTQAQVCFTNREAAKEFAKNMLRDVHSSLALGMKIEHLRLSVSPNDYNAKCKCPECGKLVDDDGLSTSMVVNFANMVAEEVQKEFPNVRIVFYAYDNYTRPPDKVKPGHMVCPELVFWTWGGSVAANHAKPMFSDANPKYKNYFKQWSDMSDGISSHEYYGHYFWFTPWPKITQMSVDIPEMCKNPKFYGMYSESHLHWGTQGPNFYLHPKLMWNPKLDVKKTMDDYYTSAFGPAAPYIKEYYEVLQQRMDSLSYVSGTTTEIPLLFSSDVTGKCNSLIEKASALMGGMDENTRWRTGLVVDGWRYSVKTADAIRLYVSPSGDFKAAKGQIKKNLEEVIEFSATQHGRWVFEQRMVDAAVGGILKSVSVDFEALPPGQTQYSDYMLNGGATKFFADIKGMSADTWGYSMNPGQSGEIIIPVNAAPGHKVKSIQLRFNWIPTDPKEMDVVLSLIKADGSKSIIASGLNASSGLITVDPSLLGERQKIHVECKYSGAKSDVVLTNFNANIEVE